MHILAPPPAKNATLVQFNNLFKNASVSYVKMRMIALSLGLSED